MVTKNCDECGVEFSISQMDPSDLCDDCHYGDLAKKSGGECIDHKWVWSGVPKGSVWCADCQVDHNEADHGTIKDLAEML